MTYEKYQSDCKSKGFKPTMTEKQFNEMQNNINTLETVRIDKDSRPIEANMENYETHNS